MRELTRLRHITCIALIHVLCMVPPCLAENRDGAGDLGVDYAFMILMTLSPDFAAANYSIDDVNITISRLPLRSTLSSWKGGELLGEFAAAFQNTEEVLDTYPAPDEYIDSRWQTYGAGIGLIYEKSVLERLKLTPSIRYGIARMENRARYYGPQTQLLKELLDNSILNWETNTSVLNLGIGGAYDWTLLDRSSRVYLDIFHVLVDSFNESSSDLKFTEIANMATLSADMIFPSPLTLYEHRLDFVATLGTTLFFGENRRTLGYTTSYQTGVGFEFPIRWKSTAIGHLRLSGEYLWADNMSGWLLSLGYNPE